MELRVRALDATPSTNAEVKRAIEAGEAEGLVVRARVQTRGYGRQGRSWTSPEGGLYCSLLLRPAVPVGELPTLSLVVSVALLRSLQGLGVAGARIKWPNDLVLVGEDVPGARGTGTERGAGGGGALGADTGVAVDGGAGAGACGAPDARAVVPSDGAPAQAAFRKLCGISLEAHAGGVCVGVGVNVVRPADGGANVGGKNEPAYVAETAAQLMGLPVRKAIDAVFERFVDAFRPLYAAWCADGFAPLVDEYNAWAALPGRTVSMVDLAGRELAAGEVVRVDGSGRLVLRDAAGCKRAVASGEAHLR